MFWLTLSIQSLEEIITKEAFEDPRFSPITVEEFSQMQIELSFLTPPRPIEPDRIQRGVHGVMIEHGEQAALFLPKVALEKEWTIATLFENLCLKAGLPQNAWKEGAALKAFQTQVFKEE